MKNYDLIFDDFVSKFGNKKILYNGYDIWPLLKINIGTQIHILLHSNRKNYNKNYNTNSNGKRKNIIIFILKHIYNLYIYFTTRKSKSSLAVITTNKHKYFKLNGAFENQFTDPFLDYFKENNIKYDVINRESLTDIISKGSRIDIFFRRHYLYPSAYLEFNNNYELHRYLNDISDYFFKNFGNNKMYDLFSKVIIEQEILSRRIKLFLKYRNYKTILYYCYYSPVNYTINRVSKELGIKTVEYQHSQISSNHFAYCGWNAYDDSTFFPDVFWAWRESDAFHIKNEFLKFNNFESIVGGNLIISRIKANIKPKLASAKRILVTMQGIGIPDFIEESIGLNSEYIWHFRMHPGFLSEKKLLESLKEKYPECVEIDLANNLSIYELFLSVKYHMTAFSGSAIEAQCFGVQNIIFSEKGLTAYKKQIESKSYYYVENTCQLKNILKNERISPVSSEEVLTDENAIRDNIKRVFVT